MSCQLPTSIPARSKPSLDLKTKTLQKLTPLRSRGRTKKQYWPGLKSQKQTAWKAHPENNSQRLTLLELLEEWWQRVETPPRFLWAILLKQEGGKKPQLSNNLTYTTSPIQGWESQNTWCKNKYLRDNTALTPSSSNPPSLPWYPLEQNGSFLLMRNNCVLYSSQNMIIRFPLLLEAFRGYIAFSIQHSTLP